MTDEEFSMLLAVGHESTDVEFKGPGSATDKPFLAKVARAAIGMANQRDGGKVIIGVKEGKPPEPVGLGPEMAEGWRNYDVVVEAINGYADPSLSLDIEEKVYSGNTFIVLIVLEFREIPILCSKDFTSSGKTILRAGACYVRSLHKPETAEIRSQQEMRSLIDLAVVKGVRRFVETARAAGVLPDLRSLSPVLTDADRFDKQLEEIP